MRQVKQNTEHGEKDDTAGKEAQLKTGDAQLQLLGGDAIEPAEAGE